MEETEKEYQEYFIVTYQVRKFDYQTLSCPDRGDILLKKTRISADTLDEALEWLRNRDWGFTRVKKVQRVTEDLGIEDVPL